MRLTDHEIKKALYDSECKLEIVPSPVKISGITADLTLGNSFRRMSRTDGIHIDYHAEIPRHAQIKSIDVGNTVEDDIYTPTVVLEEGGMFCLHPGEMALGITAERVAIPDDMVGWLDGRSSLARLGLFVHVTAGRIDPGWDGNIVLEFYNASPRTMNLRPGIGIASISFEVLGSEVDTPYRLRDDAKYQNQTTTIGSRISEDR